MEFRHIYNNRVRFYKVVNCIILHEVHILIPHKHNEYAGQTTFFSNYKARR